MTLPPGSANDPNLPVVATPPAVQPSAANLRGALPPPGRKARRSNPLVVLLLFLLGVFVATRLVHHENSSEALAGAVTRAIANNDMRPVEGDFNAIERPQLENRGRVGELSDFVNALGAFKSVKEDTAQGSQDQYHHFIVTFEKGTRSEDMTLDADGKIASFHIRPAP